jgi:protease secretion system membrane fusion protein
VTANGTVKVSGYRKSIQHPAGGVIQEILVKEGDSVKEGDILIRVNPLKTDADYAAVDLQYINALVTEARLNAELRGSSEITWPAELRVRSKEREVVEAESIQANLFQTRRNEYKTAISSKRAQLNSLTEEAKNNQQLAEEGFVSKSQANQVNRARIDAEIALNALESGYYKEIKTQLADIQKVRDSFKQNLDLVQFNRDLSAIRAPVTGTVVGLKVNTKGGTISPGQILGEVVPKEAELVVDAEIPAHGIERLHPNMDVDLRFVTLNTHLTPVIPGKLVSINPDKESDPQQQGKDKEFYLGRVVADKSALEKLGNAKIQPGMPVNVVVKVGERTVLSYIIKPLADRYAMAFKE